MTDLVPTIDPNPLPAPHWVFDVLLVTTFVLHILAMNLVLGGGALALLARWRLRNGEIGQRISRDLARKLPIFLPAAITLGIAPLLFVQVLYGQFLYTSSILMAWPWFLVLLALTATYYGFYFVSFRGGRPGGGAGVVLACSMILVLWIGFVFSNNLTLSQSPERWGEKYLASPSGWHLNLGEPTLFPRFLHFAVAAVAVGGLFLVVSSLANWKRDPDYARQTLKLGGKAFTYATMAQFIVGIAFLITLPRELRMLPLGDDLLATVLFLVAVAGGLGAIFLMSDALRKENVRVAALLVPGLTAVVIACMSVLRDLLRNGYLQRHLHPGELAVKTQWSVLPLFLLLFLGGVALWFLMLRRYGLLRKDPAPDRPAAP
ncbi:MAG TPA: hypothetical protein VMU15_08700 [Anaeromyxobacter sp.]|nr:hypothetical protein [Anaeromyxobacter sp.]